MKTHSQEFKNQIKELGRELDSKITYTIDNEEIELGNEELNSITPHYEGNILKSVMKQLDVDSNVDIPIGTQINAQFGIKIDDEYEYLNYGNYIVYSSEKQEDTRSYKIIAYDKMLYSMIDYVDLGITYPITIRNYINAICTHLGLTFKNSSDNFVNYNKQIQSELYLDSNGNSLDYTFRDVLDELAQVTASTICINEDDELEIRYINQTQGKNELNNQATTQTLNGVEITKNEDGTLTLNGTATRFTTFNVFQGTTFVDKSDIYTFYAGTKTMPIWVYVFEYYNNTWNQIVDRQKIGSFTPSQQATNHLFRLTFTTGTTFNNDIIYPMLVKGNYTLSTIGDYEPYGDTIDEEYLKNINVNFGEKYGPINTISFKRSGNSDVISKSTPSDLADDLKNEISISDNQILNGNNRDEYIDGILNELYGLEYYINDYSSTGICYLDLCDRYNVKVDNKFYSCIMFNDEVDITQGLEEKIHTEMPEDSVTDYKKASTTDRKLNQAYIIVDKVNNEITALTSETQALSTQVNNNYQELLASVQNLDNSVTQLDTRTTQVEQSQTDTYTKTEIREIITGTNQDGVNVTSLKSTSATFDEGGMHYAKTGALTSSTINQSGLEVDDNSGTQLLFAGYDEELLQALVRVANLYLTRYLGFENWRLEEVEDSEYGIGLGFFYTGGE